MLLEYYRVRDSAHPPTRANPSDAGLDVYFNPENATKEINIEAGQSAVLPTGLKFGIPHGYMLEVKNRSSMANVGTGPQVLSPQTKIAQVVMVPVVHFRALETISDNLYDWYPITISDRGDGALGSTGE